MLTLCFLSAVALQYHEFRESLTASYAEYVIIYNLCVCVCVCVLIEHPHLEGRTYDVQSSDIDVPIVLMFNPLYTT